MKSSFIVVIATASIVTAGVGALVAEDLGLDDARRLAANNDPGLEAAAAEVEAAGYEVKVAGADAWPTLAASGSYGKFGGDVLFGRFIPGVPGDGSMPVGDFDTNSLVNLELKQVLYSGGAVGAARRARDVERRTAAERLREGRLDLDYRVTRSYYEVVLAERRLEVAERSIARSVEGLESVRTRHAVQEALDVELLGAESQLAADRLARLEAVNALELAHRALGRLIGRTGGDRPTLTTSLEQPTAVIPESEALSGASQSSPAVRQAELGVARAEAALGGAQALARPKLELVGLYSWIDNELFFKGDYAAATINVSIPFLQDIKAGRAARRVAEARRREADALRRSAVDEVELAVERGYRELDEALLAVDVARGILAYHEESSRVTLSAYREQIVTFGEVLDSHEELSKAELALYGAHFQARIAEAELRRALGD